MQRLFPTPSADCTIDDAYAAPLGSRTDRPWIGLCMVASIDGSTVIDGRSSGLSSTNDSAVLLRLRSVADVIIVGAGTVRGEGYGPPKKPGQRIGVVTASGSVDTSIDLFTSGSGFVITTDDADIAGRGVDVIRAGRTHVDLARAVGEIPSICDRCDFIQAEGGSTLNGALAQADLFDELNLTTSPGVMGGDGPRLTTTTADLAHRFDLIQLAIDDESFVFSRWRRRPATSSP